MHAPGEQRRLGDKLAVCTTSASASICWEEVCGSHGVDGIVCFGRGGGRACESLSMRAATCEAGAVPMSTVGWGLLRRCTNRATKARVWVCSHADHSLGFAEVVCRPAGAMGCCLTGCQQLCLGHSQSLSIAWCVAR